jgi:glycosyltransferase 2 family protein
MKRRLRPLRLLNYALAAAALAFVLWQLHLPTLRQDLAGIVWWMVAVALLLDVFSVGLQALRWRYLLRPSRPPFRTVLQASYIGILFNEVLPLRTGDVARGLIVARRTGRGLATVLSTEVVERVADGLSLVVLVWVAMRRLHLPESLRIGQMALEIVVGVVVVVFLLLALRGESFGEWLLGRRPRGRVGRQIRLVSVDLMAGLKVLRDVRAVVVAAVIALLMNIVQVLILWIMLRAFNIDLSVLHAAAVLAIISVGIFLPNTPGNIGPWQFFCVLGLTLFGVDSTSAAGFSLVAFVLLTLPLVGGGAVSLATSPFTWSELRRYPSVDEPLGGALELVAEEEGISVPPGGWDADQHAAVDGLFRAHGYNSTAYLASEGGLGIFLAPHDAGFIAYAETAGVAVALGEPIAATDNVGRVVHSFEAALALRGIDQVLFYGVTSRAAPALAEAHYRLMPLGPEAVFPLETHSFAGGPMKGLRHKINYLTKAGAVVVEISLGRGSIEYRPHPQSDRPLPPPEEALRQMREVTALWEARRDVGTLGFTVSKPSLDRPGARRYFALFLADRLEGFFTYEPIPARDGWYLDCERRRPDAPQGVTETLVAESHRVLREEGAALVSWGTTALARPEAADDAFRDEHRLLDEAFALAYRALGFIYPYQGLYENKAKYHPVWEETFLAFRPRFGPRMAYAIVKTHHPEGVPDLLLSRLRAGRQRTGSEDEPSASSHQGSTPGV